MYLYTTQPIDWFIHCLSEKEILQKFIEADYSREPCGSEHRLASVISNICMLSNFKQDALNYARNTGYWEGDITDGFYYFALPNPDCASTTYGIIWKQKNNGMTFVASPIELNYLNEDRV